MHMRAIAWSVCTAVGAASLLAVAASAQEVTGAAAAPSLPKAVNVTQAQLSDAGKQGTNWLHTQRQLRPDPLLPRQSDQHQERHRVSRPAFVFQTEVLESMETAPIVVDGVMFLTTSYNHVYAIDAATGEEFWHYKHKMGPVTTFCCGPNNRGVAIAGDRLFMGTLDAKLVALDAKTGKRAVGNADRRSGKGLQRDDGADRRRRQGAHRHQRRRIRRSRLRQGVRRRRRQARCGPSTPSPKRAMKVCGRRTTRPAATCIATSRPRRAALREGRLVLPDAGRRRVDEPVDRPQDAHGCTSSWAIRRPTCMARSVRATTSTPTRWSRSTSTRARTSATSSTSPHDVWDLDAVSPTILVDAKDKDRQDDARASCTAARPATSTCTTAANCELIRFSEAMIPQENMWVLPTKEGARMLPGANGGVEWSPMAFNPKTAPGLRRSTCTSR